jgi:hypothetical protein
LPLLVRGSETRERDDGLVFLVVFAIIHLERRAPQAGRLNVGR